MADRKWGTWEWHNAIKALWDAGLLARLEALEVRPIGYSRFSEQEAQDIRMHTMRFR